MPAPSSHRARAASRAVDSPVASIAFSALGFSTVAPARAAVSSPGPEVSTRTGRPVSRIAAIRVARSSPLMPPGREPLMVTASIGGMAPVSRAPTSASSCCTSAALSCGPGSYSPVAPLASTTARVRRVVPSIHVQAWRSRGSACAGAWAESVPASAVPAALASAASEVPGRPAVAASRRRSSSPAGPPRGPAQVTGSPSWASTLATLTPLPPASVRTSRTRFTSCRRVSSTV